MRTFPLLASLFIIIFLTACEVKQKKPTDELISNHLPTTNTFTIQAPTSNTFILSDTLSFTLSFPFDVIIDATGGSPRLRITIGVTTRYATYSAGADPKKLIFNYTVQAGEDDLDGVTVNALELNGSTLKFNYNGTIMDCDHTSVVPTTYSDVIVDTLMADNFIQLDSFLLEDENYIKLQARVSSDSPAIHHNDGLTYVNIWMNGKIEHFQIDELASSDDFSTFSLMILAQDFIPNTSALILDQ